MMAMVKTNGNSIHCLDKGRGRPLVLLHGFPLDGRVWAGQIDRLAERYRVIVPDLPGFGRSRAAGAFSILSLAEDMRALLKRLDALPCVVGGLSMGGYIAFAWAQMCPTDIDGMILIDTKPDADTTEARQNRNRMIELAGGSGSRAVADDMMPRLLSPQTLSNDPQTVQDLRTMIEAQPPQTLQWALAAMRDREDLVDFTESIADPTLIIVGEHDALTPPDLAERMHRSIRQSRLQIIRNAGHLTPIEKPRETADAMRQFLDECF